MRQEEIDDIKFPPKEKSLVVQALTEANVYLKHQGFLPSCQTRIRVTKAIRIAEIEHKAIQELQKLRARWNHSALTHDYTKDEKVCESCKLRDRIDALLAEYTEAVK
jgi:hypothetical protein